MKSISIAFGLYVSILWLASFTTDRSVIQMLSYLDSQWYSHISTYGYGVSISKVLLAEHSFAFFPVWPLFLRAAAAIAFPFDRHLLGAILSTGCIFLAFFILELDRQERHSKLFETQTSRLALTFYALSPGSYIFFTNHTESLFLLLSILGFLAAVGRRYVFAGLIAGLACLTRNQGVVLAIALGVLGLLQEGPLSRKAALKSFVIVGMLSASHYSLWLLFLQIKTGSPFASVAIQANWKIVRSLSEYLDNFFWMSTHRLERRVLFWVIICWSLRTLVKGKTPLQKSYGLYVLLSVLLWPLQGNNLPQAYRFGIVLFPFWLAVGRLMERLANLPAILRTTAFAALLVWPIEVCSQYFWQFGWPY